MTEQQIIFAGVGTFITLILIFCIVKLIRKATAQKKTAEQTTKIEVENFEEVTIETDDNIEEELITSPQADNITKEESTIIKTKVKDVYHISQNKNNESDHSKEWRVRKQGSEKTIKYFSTQKEAIKFAEESASKNNGKVVIHKLSGDIRKNRYN